MWNMEAIGEAITQARMELYQIQTIADRRLDPTLMLCTARLGQALNEIEKRARDARWNQWDETATE